MQLIDIQVARESGQVNTYIADQWLQPCTVSLLHVHINTRKCFAKSILIFYHITEVPLDIHTAM